MVGEPMVSWVATYIPCQPGVASRLEREPGTPPRLAEAQKVVNENPSSTRGSLCAIYPHATLAPAATSGGAGPQGFGSTMRSANL